MTNRQRKLNKALNLFPRKPESVWKTVVHAIVVGVVSGIITGILGGFAAFRRWG